MPTEVQSKTSNLQHVLTAAVKLVDALFQQALSDNKLLHLSRSLLVRCATAKLAGLDLLAPGNIDFIFAGTEFSTVIKTPNQIESFWHAIVEVTAETYERHNRHPAIALMEIYERSLEYRIQREQSTINLESLANLKKRGGQFYTPLSLARRTTRLALDRFCADSARLQRWREEPIRILDPAMGAGIFLICALEYLEECFAKIEFAKPSERPEHKDLMSCIYGVDIDESALEATQLALWLFCLPKSSPQIEQSLSPIEIPITISMCRKNLRCADALLSQWSKRKDTVNAAHKSINDDCKIFYWAHEYPEIFEVTEASESPAISGFDIVVSNPPWELAKPNSQEFFSFASPNFRKLGKQEASAHSAKLLQEREELQGSWNRELESYKLKSKFLRDAMGKESVDSAGQRTLFKSLGQSDLNAYKLFLDLGFSLLKGDGYLTMIVPSGILVDKGAFGIRERFLKEGRIIAIQTFTNTDATFKIHRSFTYSLLSAQKGGATEEFMASFGNANSKAPVDVSSKNAFIYSYKDIKLLSPKWLTILEVEHPKDLQVLRRIQEASTVLTDAVSVDSRKDGNWSVRFKREFDMTNDSNLFQSVESARADGYKVDIYGNWLLGDWQVLHSQDDYSAIAQHTIPNLVPSADGLFGIRTDAIRQIKLPLYEGRMLGQFDHSEKLHIEGTGRTAVWQKNSEAIWSFADDHNSDNRFTNALLASSRNIQPHYLVAGGDSWSRETASLKIGYLAVGSPTNVRTMLASALFLSPCGNSVPVFYLPEQTEKALLLIACFNSLVFDYCLRMRMTGNNVNYFLLQECPLPFFGSFENSHKIALLVAALNLNHIRFARWWSELTANFPNESSSSSNLYFPQTAYQRLKIRAVIDALVADAYQLTDEELHWILRDCDKTPANKSTETTLPAKGFWRSEKSALVENRLPNMVLNCFRDLHLNGRENFVERNLSECLTLNDLTGSDQTLLCWWNRNLCEILNLP